MMHSAHHSNAPPDDVLINIFQFLRIKDIASIPRLSKKWNKVFYSPAFWEKNNCSDRSLDFLSLALFNAVINKKSKEVIIQYCTLGANPNKYVRKYVEKRYGFFDPKLSFFSHSTALSVAANQASNQYGREIVKMLLRYGANPILKSRFTIQYFQPPGYLTPEEIFEETPNYSALDKQTKVLLCLAIHRYAIEHNKANLAESSLLEAITLQKK